MINEMWFNSIHFLFSGIIYFELLHPLQISPDGHPNEDGKWPNWYEIVCNLKEQNFPHDAFKYGDEPLDLQAKSLVFSMLLKNGKERPTALDIKKGLRKHIEMNSHGNS